MYKTQEVIDLLIEYINSDSRLNLKQLKSKKDLNYTGIAPKSFIQFVENRYINETSLYFAPVFNIYVIGKSLGGIKQTGIYDVLDVMRQKIANHRFEYKKYIDKRANIVIENESFTEVQGDTFVYVLRFKINAKIYNNF